nr:hypothetical protein [Rhizobium sp. ACO-34A]
MKTDNAKSEHLRVIKNFQSEEGNVAGKSAWVKERKLNEMHDAHPLRVEAGIRLLLLDKLLPVFNCPSEADIAN